MTIRNLNVLRAGARFGVPALFLHSGLGRAGMWRPVWSEMPRFSLTAPDLPGHGGTGYQDWRDFQVQAVEDALAAAPPSPVHLVGHSLGGTVALRIALDYPDQVRSLTLIEPVCFAFLHDAGDSQYERYLEDMRPLAEAFAAEDMDRAADLFLGVWNAARSSDLSVADRKSMVDLMPLIQASEASILDLDTEGRLQLKDLERLRRPTLLMMGANTQPVIRRIQKTLREALPGAEAARVADAGHMVPLDQPERVAKRIKAFWRRNRARG